MKEMNLFQQLFINYLKQILKEIENIIQRYENIDFSKERTALGTLVKVEGSAYRRIGARMYVSDNGNWVGGISGGCLEGDALKRAKIAILKNESSIVVYDTTEDDPHQLGVGLGCNGRIEVLFTPIDSTNENNQIEFLKRITNRREATILLQVLSVKGGDSKMRGNFYSRENFIELAEIIGIPESEILQRIATVIHRRKSRVYVFENKNGEQYEILVELIRPKIKLICIGDNYDVNAFIGIANELGWEIQVAGKPRKFSKIIHKYAQKTYSLEEAGNIEFDEYTAVVMMSHDYNTDFNLLKKYLKKDIPYIGMLGPKKRFLKMQDELNEAGETINLNDLPNLFAPVGIDIGAESPEEIALSVAGEIIAVFRERNGGFLRRREGSIHERF
ncbi:MAG: xanthine dehydrogenase accessory factor [Saprospiraceae bacterium]|jgi:xanthine dehydrogenase accessory factor